MIRVATRGSRQAMAQATAVADLLADASGGPVELVRVDTVGDRTQGADVPLHSIGGQGVFVKEVQLAVLDGRADVAVHSAKDLPTAAADGLTIAAYTERRSPHDALVGARLGDLADGATVASGSVRRRAQLARVRPDLRFVELRGNIDTRLTKVPDGGALVMAVAAMQILGLEEHIAEVLPLETFVPAVGQGCVAVECRADDPTTIEAVAHLDHEPTRRAVEVERAFLGELGSGCSLPVGAHVAGRTLHTFLAGDPTAAGGSDAPPAEPRTVSDDTVELPDDHGAALVAARSAAIAARRAVGP